MKRKITIALQVSIVATLLGLTLAVSLPRVHAALPGPGAPITKGQKIVMATHSFNVFIGPVRPNARTPDVKPGPGPLAGPAWAADSECFGTTSRGRIEGSVALPTRGPNFSPYSRLAVSVGRTHVHAKVAEIVTEAYAEMAKLAPDVHYVYGETGLPAGGRFRPHRSHQNGLSVDFFMPVRDSLACDATRPLPAAASQLHEGHTVGAA